MKHTIIKCPNCGREYAAGEVFIPKYLTGVPTKIIRDGDTILTIEGLEPDFNETFYCDKCNTLFEIQAKLSYNVKAKEANKFDTDYIHEYNKKYILNED